MRDAARIVYTWRVPAAGESELGEELHINLVGSDATN